MHGIIFFQLQRFAEQTFGPSGWSQLFAQANLPQRAYSPAAAYEDNDVFLLVKAASVLASQSPQAVLEAFGEFVAPELLGLHSQAIDPQWGTLDLIANTEQTIHALVRAKNSQARPPVLRAQRVSGNQVNLVYSSPRQLCSLAKGIVKGLARHFSETVEVVDESCMLNGDPFCSMAFTNIGGSKTLEFSQNATLVSQNISPWGDTRHGTGATSDRSVTFGPSRCDPRTERCMGQYRMGRLLGKGGMGEVYLAEDTLLERSVAVKILPKRMADETMRERFVREARSMAAIQHEHVLTIYHVGEEDGVPFIVMPCLQGTTLADWLSEGNRASISRALQITCETLDALHAAHLRKFLHRDVKPSNIWLEAPKGSVKLMDFGLAGGIEEAGHLTTPGMVIGTPKYMPPEFTECEYNERSDLFSVGVVLYEMLTGAPPFAGDSIRAILHQVITSHPPPPSSKNPDVGSELDEFVMQLLAKEPSVRPESAAAAINMIRTMNPNVAAPV